MSKIRIGTLREMHSSPTRSFKVFVAMMGCVVLALVLVVLLMFPFGLETIPMGDVSYIYKGDNRELWYMVVSAEGDIVCPETFLFDRIEGVSLLMNDGVTSLTISSGIREVDTYNASLQLKAYCVKDGNGHFYAEDGILYSKDGKKLVAYPAAKEGVVYELPKSVEVIGDYSLTYSRFIEKLVIRNESVVSIESPFVFKLEKEPMNIYVPDNLVEQYKSTDGWKEYADYIFPLSTFES